MNKKVELFERELDDEIIKNLNPKDWQLNLMHKNPSYVYWGNGEDCMLDSDHKGWDSGVVLDSVKELFELDELNELINFYFFLTRESEECPHCKNGLTHKASDIDRTWYSYLCKEGETSWQFNLTQDEVDALWEKGRLNNYKEKPTAEMVNHDAQTKQLWHDSINQWICVEQRCKRLGIEYECPVCNGKGYLNNDKNVCNIGLQMWFIHPRKGASRGIILKTIKEDEVPFIIEYLKEARTRNYDRFSKL